MGCCGSSAKNAPPPAGACKLTLKNNASMMAFGADKGFSLFNEEKEKVMELMHSEPLGLFSVEWMSTKKTVDTLANNVMDGSLLMYVCTETVTFINGDGINADGINAKLWEDDLKSAVKEDSNVQIGPDKVELKSQGPGVHRWQIELKSTIYSDATKSKEFASITIKAQGLSNLCVQGTTNERGIHQDKYMYISQYTDGIKYALVVEGVDVPVEHESGTPTRGGQAGIKLKTDLFTLEATIDRLWSNEFVKGAGQTRTVSIHKTGDEAVLGAVIGGVIGMDLLPTTLKIWLIQCNLPNAAGGESVAAIRLRDKRDKNF